MPPVGKVFESARLWLMAAGIQRVRMGFYDPTEEGAPSCTAPIAGMMPGKARMINDATPGGWQEMPLDVVVWAPQNGTGFFWSQEQPTQWGGFGTLMEIHDRLFAGPAVPIAPNPPTPLLNPTIAGMFPSRATSSFSPVPDSWELWWFTGAGGGPVAAEFQLMLKYRVGPSAVDPLARYIP